jgi:hypothetical protein
MLTPLDEVADYFVDEVLDLSVLDRARGDALSASRQ